MLNDSSKIRKITFGSIVYFNIPEYSDFYACTEGFMETKLDLC
jgi:hypothetical protein